MRSVLSAVLLLSLTVSSGCARAADSAAVEVETQRSGDVPTVSDRPLVELNVLKKLPGVLLSPEREPGPATPDATINAVVKAWRENDAAALFEQLPDAPPRQQWVASWAKMQAKDKADRKNGTVAATDVKIDGYLEKFRTDPGVEQIIDELHAQFAPHIPGLLLGAHAALAQMQTADLSSHPDPETAAKVQRVGAGVQDWLDAVDLSDRALLGRAFVPIVEVVREHQLFSTEALAANDVEALIAIGADLMRAIQQSLAVYDVNLDSFLQTTSASLAAREGNRADIALSTTLFGQSLTVPIPMFLHEGEWMNQGQYQARLARASAKTKPEIPAQDSDD